MLFRYYRQLVEQVDKWTSEITRQYRNYLVCRKGCDLCCQRKLTVSAVEAYNIALTFSQLPRDTKRRIGERKTSCAFLVDGVCSIYDSRPVICRTFGLPSLHRNEQDEGVVSWCELNFTNVEEDFQLSAEGIIDIDTLNLKLSGVNGLFLKESGTTEERIALDEIPNLNTGVVEGRD